MNSAHINSVRGNVIFIILVAVALFAYLSFAITQSGRDTQTMNKEENSLIVDEFVAYGSKIEMAVQDLLLNKGCSDQEISFESPKYAEFTGWVGGFASEYVNSFSPTDESCHVFSANGGGVDIKIAIPALWENAVGDITAWVNGLKMINYTGELSVPGFGNHAWGNVVDAPHYELIVYAFTSLEVCHAMNDRVGIPREADGSPASRNINGMNVTGVAFNGNYGRQTGRRNAIGTSSDLRWSGHKIGCFLSTSGPGSAGAHLYYVVHVR